MTGTIHSSCVFVCKLFMQLKKAEHNTFASKCAIRHMWYAINLAEGYLSSFSGKLLACS